MQASTRMAHGRKAVRLVVQFTTQLQRPSTCVPTLSLWAKEEIVAYGLQGNSVKGRATTLFSLSWMEGSHMLIQSEVAPRHALAKGRQNGIHDHTACSSPRSSGSQQSLQMLAYLLGQND